MKIDITKILNFEGNFLPLEYSNIKKGMYLINETGDIYSLKSNKILSKTSNKDGYLKIGLQTEEGGRYVYGIATLVINTFIGNPPENMIDPTIDHIDSNVTNNHYSNLRWLERGINSSIRKIKPKGEINGQHILTENEVLEICELLINTNMSLKEIGGLYNVDKSTISNIKRKKTWVYLTKDYKFEIKKQKNKEESKKQREEIKELLLKGNRYTDIVKMGYPKSVVSRVIKIFGSTGSR